MSYLALSLTLYFLFPVSVSYCLSVQQAKQSLKQSAPESRNWLITASLIFVFASNLGPTRESQIHILTHHILCPTSSFSTNSFSSPGASNQDIPVAFSFFFSKVFPLWVSAKCKWWWLTIARLAFSYLDCLHVFILPPLSPWGSTS